MTRVAVSFVLVFVFLAVNPVAGQESLVKVAGGFASTWDPRADLNGVPPWLLRGGSVSIDYQVSRRFSVVATVSRTAAHDQTSLHLTWSGSDTFAGGGVRFVGRRSPRLELSVDALVGGWRRVGKSHWEAPNPLGFADSSETATAVAALTGGGLALYLVRRVGVRSGLELEFLSSRTSEPIFRFTTELVLGIGSMK